jgi:hypothetical protein
MRKITYEGERERERIGTHKELMMGVLLLEEDAPAEVELLVCGRPCAVAVGDVLATRCCGHRWSLSSSYSPASALSISAPV